jgi:hypothetical protein
MDLTRFSALFFLLAFTFCQMCRSDPAAFFELEKKSDERFEIVFQTLEQILSTENSPHKKIGFTAKEKQACFGKHK